MNRLSGLLFLLLNVVVSSKNYTVASYWVAFEIRILGGKTYWVRRNIYLSPVTSLFFPYVFSTASFPAIVTRKDCAWCCSFLYVTLIARLYSFNSRNLVDFISANIKEGKKVYTFGTFSSLREERNCPKSGRILYPYWRQWYLKELILQFDRGKGRE